MKLWFQGHFAAISLPNSFDCYIVQGVDREARQQLHWSVWQQAVGVQLQQGQDHGKMAAPHPSKKVWVGRVVCIFKITENFRF